MMDALTLHRLLLDSGVQHEIVHLRASISSADQLPTVLDLPPARCLAVRMYETGRTAPGPDGAPALIAVIVWSGHAPATEELRRVTGEQRLRAAPGDAVNEATGYAAGLVSPLALPDTVEVYADEHVISGLGHDAVVYTATGEARTALGIRLPDLFALCPAKQTALAVSGPVPGQDAARPEIRSIR